MKFVHIFNIILSYYNFYVIIFKWCMSIRYFLCLTFEYFSFIFCFSFIWKCL